MPARSSTPSGAASARPPRSSTRRSPRSTPRELNASAHLDREWAYRGRGRAPTCRKPFGGRPDRDQGARAGRGLAVQRSVARLRGPRRRPHVARSSSACSSAAARCPVGLDHRERVRRPQRERDEAQRRHPQPVAHGRTVGRLVGRDRAAAVAGGLVSLATGGDGGGSIRIPAGLHRPARHEGHLRSHPAQPARVHAAEHRRARQPRPIGARRGALLRRVRRLRTRAIPTCLPSRGPAGRRASARTSSRPAGRGRPRARRRPARARRRRARARRGGRARSRPPAWCEVDLAHRAPEPGGCSG